MKAARLAICATAILGAAPSWATTKQECAAAYEQTQSLRKDGALAKAREQALVCSRDDCPDVVRDDCVTWLNEIERSVPTVVLVASDATGSPIADVRVFDGEALLRDRLDGKAVPLDPGPHVLRFERLSSSAIERKVLLNEGDKLVRVEVTFASPSKSHREGLPVLPLIVGGAGVVGLGIAATLGITALNERANLKATCAPRCAEAAVDALHTKLIIADVTGGVSIAALATATVLFLTTPRVKSDTKGTGLHLEIAPASGGAYVGIQGAF